MDMQVDQSSGDWMHAQIILHTRIGPRWVRDEPLVATLGQVSVNETDLSVVKEKIEVRVAIEGRAQVAVALPVAVDDSFCV
jgi:hypothetical protein